MNTFQAACFLSLSKTLNFTQTSEEMYVSQPTLSRNIAALEHEVGVQLVIRNTKTVELTAAGKQFAEVCSLLLETFHNGILEARKAKDGMIGRLTLGIQRDAFEPFIVDLVNAYRDAHPQIQLNLCPMSLSELMQKLNAGTLDLIVSAGETNLKKPGRLLLSERQECAALPSDHPLADRSSIRMEELQNESFVAMSPLASNSGHYLLQHYAQAADFTPNIVAMVDSVPALMMLVACHAGVSVLYHDLEIHVRGRVRFVPLEGIESFKRYLLWDQENPNPAIDDFVAFAKDVIKNINPESVLMSQKDYTAHG